MKAKSLKISAIDKTASKKVAQMVKNGGVAVVPTETVYGFAADVFNLSAKKRIFSLKGRNYKKPLIAMAYDLESLKILVNLSNEALKLAQTFWPGRLTLILNTTNIGKIVSGGREDIGVRIPDHKFMLEFLKEIKTPVWTTSVNISKENSAKDFSQTLIFEGKANILVDGGKCKYSFESTVIDAKAYPFTVLRKGSLDISEILKVL